MAKGTSKERLKEIFETTLDSGIVYEGSLERIDYYSLFCKAASKDKLYKFMGNNLCMFNCKFEEKDAVMMIFYIAINSDDNGAKNVAERVMEVLREVETCFITLSSVKSEEIKEEKFIYVTMIKTI